jgi:hypothetical protein
MRYVHAFWKALLMTARGQQVPPPAYPDLTVWAQQTVALLDELDAAFAQNQVRADVITVRLDGRDMSAQKALSVVRFHAAEEIRSLARVYGHYNLLAIQATNINDRYWVSRLAEQPAMSAAPVQGVFQRLIAHLDAIPKP